MPGRGERFIWTAFFFPLGFDERMHMNRDMEMDDSRRTSHIPPHLTHRPTRQITGSTFDKPCSTIQLSSTRSPTFTGRQAHLEDDATSTRQWRETFGDRLTGPQLGARNSKPWRISVTSPKARLLKPLIFHFCLNQSRWRILRGNGKPCSSVYTALKTCWCGTSPTSHAAWP